MTRIAAHPDAAIFPMMSTDDLLELAADIKENGQRFPIIIGKYEDREVIIDGRNRYDACEIAGVEPKFEMLNGTDPKAFILSANVNRRHLSTGQRMMAVAMVYPKPQTTKTLVNPNGLDLTPGTFRYLLSHARAVLRHSRSLAEEVMSGTIALDAAFNEAKAAADAANSAGAMLKRLQAEAPDLAGLVIEERLQLKEAITALDTRIAEARRAQETATRVLQTIFNAVYPRGATAADWAERLTKDVSAEFWSGADALSRANLLACADVLAAIAERWKDQP